MSKLNMAGQKGKVENIENRTVDGQGKATVRSSRLPKTHQEYWRTKLKRRSYTNGDGERVEIPEWQVRMFHLNREAWFNLDTPNAAAAATKARDIYLSLLSVGWDSTLEKFKPKAAAREGGPTIGDYLKEVETRSHLRPHAFRIYTTKLRKLVSDIAGVEKGLKSKAMRSKFDYAGGGRTGWLAKVDGQKLSILNPDTITAWRNEYVSAVGSDPLKRKSAERTAASIMRTSRALFAPDVLRVVKVAALNPFEGVKLQDPGPQRYHSEVNPEWLLSLADRELRSGKPQMFLALFLCLCAGLRRKEADLLTWSQVNLEEGQIHIRRTEFFEPKTEESQRMIDISPSSVEVLRSFKKGATSDFVLKGGSPRPEVTYVHYRANSTWLELNRWLKGKGVRQRMAVHTLRKESGSLIASDFGIEAARQHLGHRDIRTTSAHYVGKKKRHEVTLWDEKHPDFPPAASL